MPYGARIGLFGNPGSFQTPLRLPSLSDGMFYEDSHRDAKCNHDHKASGGIGGLRRCGRDTAPSLSVESYCQSRLFGPKAHLLVSFFGKVCETSGRWLNYGAENCSGIKVLRLPWPGISEPF